jgi:hypothetical protein
MGSVEIIINLSPVFMINLVYHKNGHKFRCAERFIIKTGHKFKCSGRFIIKTGDKLMSSGRVIIKTGDKYTLS